MINKKFEYQNNNFFNEQDVYIFYIENFNKYIISEVHLYNGSFYTNTSLNYKCTSIPCIKFDNIYHNKIIYNGYIGKIIQALDTINSLGIQWFQGQKKIPYYWININDIKIIFNE